MRILMVSETYYPYFVAGGPPTKVRAMGRLLTAKGHEVTVLTAHLGPLTGEGRYPRVESFRGGWRAVQDGIEAIYLRTWLRYRALTFNPGVWGFCGRSISQFEVVHVFGLYDLLGPVVASHCLRQGVPYVVEPIGMFRPIVRSLRLKRWYRRLLGERMTARARLLVATSQQERQELIAEGVPPEKVVVRRNGIETPDQLPERGTFRRAWGITSGSKVVLFLGRVVPKKSPDLLIRAFAAWSRRSGETEDAQLVVAGPTEDRSYRLRLESLTRELGLARRVRFTGPLYGDAKWSAYRDANVFVLPSQNENFGNTVAEAVACGTPVLITDRCGIAALVDQRAGLVVPYGQQALEQGLSQLLGNHVELERFRRGCSQVAPELSWHAPALEMEALYQRLVYGGNS